MLTGVVSCIVLHQLDCSLVALVDLCCPSIDSPSHIPLVQAQRYQTLVDDLHQNRLQLSLTELYHNEQGIGILSNKLSEKQQAAAAQNNKLVNSEQTVKTHKKEHGRLSRELQHIEKEIRYINFMLKKCFQKASCALDLFLGFVLL